MSQVLEHQQLQAQQALTEESKAEAMRRQDEADVQAEAEKQRLRRERSVRLKEERLATVGDFSLTRGGEGRDGPTKGVPAQGSGQGREVGVGRCVCGQTRSIR